MKAATPATAARTLPALRTRSAALLVLAAALPVEVAVLLDWDAAEPEPVWPALELEPSVACAAVPVDDWTATLAVEEGNWLA